MDERKRVVITAFELASPAYDGSWNRRFDLQGEALIREAHISSGARVLDVATGTGKIALLAARAAGSEGRVLGIDLSDAMLAHARSKTADMPVEFKLMDAESLALEDEAFDTVLCGFGMAFLPDKVRGMREMHRVLRPGGRIAFSWWTRKAFQPMDDMTSARLTQQYGVPRPSAPREPWMALEEPEHLVALLEKAGFREGRVVREDIGYYISAEDWWALVTASGRQRHLSRLSQESIERLRGETLVEITRLAGDKGVWMDVSAHIGVGVRDH
jgi:ubiquinone/menaquinone biosynthesis C-methylase UbiE